VGYRLAPEAKFPLPLDDCYAATVWTVGNAAALGTDPGAVAVGGASAGGNLAAAVTLMARERGGPALAHQLLVYPVVENDDSSQSFQDYGGGRDNGEGYGLDRSTMRWYWDHYVRGEADASNPLAAPLLAHDLSGLPPALIITAEYDPLRDGGEAYADRLRQAGVQAACSRYDGMIHGFFSAGSPVDRTWDAIAEAAAALRAAFAASAGPAS
ncbi:MAG: alpha/beta hydrolase, partial [Chloroflexi bacterium]|nr:alpha/beta hydrolase [Chloroflexota bacterium]